MWRRPSSASRARRTSPLPSSVRRGAGAHLARRRRCRGRPARGAALRDANRTRAHGEVSARHARAARRHARRGAQLDRRPARLARPDGLTLGGPRGDGSDRIARIRLALERPGFRDRCFTLDEQAYCETRRNPAESYAARFCGKEAVGKALGCGVLFTWKEIEIVGPPKPGVTLSGKTSASGRAGRHARDRRLAHALAHDGGVQRASPISRRRRLHGSTSLRSTMPPVRPCCTPPTRCAEPRRAIPATPTRRTS